MYRRLVLSIYLALQSAAVFAEPKAWNCDKSSKNSQWGCVSSTKNAAAPKSDEEIEKFFLEIQKASKRPVVKKIQNLPAITPVPRPVPLPVSASTLPTPLPLPTPAILPVKSKPLPPEPVKTPALVSQCGDQVAKTGQPCANASKTLAKTATHADDGFQLFTPTFNRAQEKIFAQLHNRLKVDPWGACVVGPNRSLNPYDALAFDAESRDTSPMNIDADYSEIFDKEVTSFAGGVVMDRADQHMTADQANYNTLSQTMDAQGHVYYDEDQLALYSDSMLLNLPKDEARIRDALFIAPRSGIRGSAKVVYQENKEFSHYKDATYTSCPPGNQDWIIHADRFKMNKQSGKGAATNAWLEFKGVPIMYTPYISFPLDSRRKTGLLPPTWGNSGQTGFSITAPFYWNIAPNYDALFKPRYLLKRGLMLGGEFRHMNTFSNSKLRFEVLPTDPLYNDATRFQTSFNSQALLTRHMSTNIDLNYVSDKKYLSDLGNGLSFTDIRHVRSAVDLNYNREDVSFLTRVENYQTIDQSIPQYLRPYRKLPQVQLNLKHDFANMPLTVGLENEFALFQHNVNVDGERLNIKPYVSAPWRNESAFAIPKASFLHTEYFLNQQFAGNSSNISRDLPILSFDTGLFAEGDLNLFGKKYTHTLEPRMFYLYVPKSSQNAQPIFDTAIYDTTFDSLFRENRFSGYDRVQNANQVTLALTSRFLDSDTGMERFKASVGNVVYFQDRQGQSVLTSNDPLNDPKNHAQALNFPIAFDQTNRFSNLVAEFSGHLTDELSFTSNFQWDFYKNSVPRQQIDLHYRNKAGYIFNVGYLHRKDLNLSPDPLGQFAYRQQDLIQLSDISFRMPLFDNWNIVGRWQYSFLFNETTDSFFGLEKENCCWRFRILQRHYINGLNLLPGTITAAYVPQTTIGTSSDPLWFQIELKSISKFGDEIDTFLKQNLYGYSQL